MLYKKSKPHVKNEIALALFKAWYIPFYNYGIIHGDPHPGNYQVNYDKGSIKINLLDFGCIRVFSPKFVKGVIDLYKAMRDDNNELAIEAYKAWGFRKLSDEVIEVLNILINSDSSLAAITIKYGSVARYVMSKAPAWVVP